MGVGGEEGTSRFVIRPPPTACVLVVYGIHRSCFLLGYFISCRPRRGELLDSNCLLFPTSVPSFLDKFVAISGPLRGSFGAASCPTDIREEADQFDESALVRNLVLNDFRKRTR